MKMKEFNTKTPSIVKAYIRTKKRIAKTSEILFEYINPNYKQRISSEMLLAVLQTLKQ